MIIQYEKKRISSQLEMRHSKFAVVYGCFCLVLFLVALARNLYGKNSTIFFCFDDKNFTYKRVVGHNSIKISYGQFEKPVCFCFCFCCCYYLRVEFAINRVDVHFITICIYAKWMQNKS